MRRARVGREAQPGDVAGDGHGSVVIFMPAAVARRPQQRPSAEKIAVGGIVPIFDIVAAAGNPLPRHEPVFADRKIMRRPLFDMPETAGVAIGLRQKQGIALTFGMARAALQIVDHPPVGLHKARAPQPPAVVRTIRGSGCRSCAAGHSGEPCEKIASIHNCSIKLRHVSASALVKADSAREITHFYSLRERNLLFSTSA